MKKFDPEVTLKLKRHQKIRIRGQCSYVDGDARRCTGPAISSHTVQKGGALKAISEGGHVYQLGAGSPFSNGRRQIQFEKIGLRKASVFPGFCKRHDNEVFKEVESDVPLTTERQAALVGYRVICLEMFKKEMNVKLFSEPTIREQARKNGRLKFMDNFVLGTKLGLADLQRAKRVYEEAIHQNIYDGFKSAVLRFDHPLPFCFASPFAPEFDFDAKLLLPKGDDEWDAVCAFAGSIAGECIFFVCGFQRPRMHDISSYIQSMDRIPSAFAGSAALHTALEYSENTFFRMSWVNALPDDVREKLKRQFGSGIPGNPNGNKADILNLANIVKISSSAPVELMQ